MICPEIQPCDLANLPEANFVLLVGAFCLMVLFAIVLVLKAMDYYYSMRWYKEKIMKNVILPIVALIALASHALATPYARLFNPKNVHQSAALLIDPNGHAPNSGVTDVCLVTHSTEDGSIIPRALQSIIPPENLCLFEMGAGGSARVYGGRLTGNAIAHVGSSVNIAPQLGSLILAKVDTGSAPLLQSVKAAMLNVGGNGVRLGWGLGLNVISDGVFQSGKESLPGRGVLDIVNRAQRLSVGWAWVW